MIGSSDGTVHFFSTDDWSAASRPFEAHAGRVISLDFSPDGRVLATAGADGAVALWDVATRKPIGTPLTLEPETSASAVFSPDGSHLFAVSTGGEGVRLDASPEAWKRHACRRRRTRPQRPRVGGRAARPAVPGRLLGRLSGASARVSGD